MFKIIKSFKNTLVILLILILITILTLFHINYNKDSNENNISNDSDISINYIEKDSVIDDIKEVNKIIPLEVRLSEKITLDDSWLNSELLEKYKEITFVANCSYYIDLSNISSDNLLIDYTNKEVSFKISKPLIYKIDFDEENTSYGETVTGLLRFGDLTLSAEDYGIIEDKITKNMSEKMMSEELYSKACTSSIDSLTKILSDILSEDYDIHIVLLD